MLSILVLYSQEAPNESFPLVGQFEVALKGARLFSRDLHRVE
jgi:hypothetical protein